jgi:SAM-dependent methyltransferase
MQTLRIPSDLDSFVADSDRLGGPGNPACESYWRDCVFLPSVEIDSAVEPYDSKYMEGMLQLYRDISGRDLNQSLNEDTSFDLMAHASAPNPYAHQTPKAIAKLMTTLLQGVSAAEKPSGCRLLDMGAGWGLSSETFEYVGYRVTAIDISDKFVQLVNRRAQNRGLAITAIQSAFDDFNPEERFDIAVFFECLHHAVEPWKLLSRIGQLLRPDGILLLLAEPVQNLWWKHWGLRLDSLSVYCIRKYGWFESGWSTSFLFDMLSRAGFSGVSVKNPGNPDHLIYLCQKSTSLSRQDLERIVSPDQFWTESEFFVSKGDVNLEFCLPIAVRSIVFDIHNFRPAKVSLAFHINGAQPILYSIESGRNPIAMPYSGGLFNVRIVSDCWCPRMEIGNSDTRMLSFHLAAIVGHLTGTPSV